jgi:hypothetical protein
MMRFMHFDIHANNDSEKTDEFRRSAMLSLGYHEEKHQENKGSSSGSPAPLSGP